MRIALTFNLRHTPSEAEAEYDSAHSIAVIARLLASLGHSVTPVEVGMPVEEVAAMLRRVRPDLVFNLAEGRHGTFREAFYPALFEQLELRHTGSSASALAVCLDKALSKRVAQAAGVPTPRGHFVRSSADPCDGLAFPVIVKPNFEGSSKGITQASVVEHPAALPAAIATALARYPDGVLVEELVDGDDVAVGWCAGIGLLPPIRYVYACDGPHRIFDLAIKQGPERSRVEVPAALASPVRERLEAAATAAFTALGVRGIGRADFRVTPDGQVWFLEMNPLPALGPDDDELYRAAEALGQSRQQLLACIVAAA